MRKTLLAVALSVTALSAHADYQCSVTPRDDVILSPQQVQVKGENGDLVIKPDGNLTFNGKAYTLSAAQREQAKDYQTELRSALPWIDDDKPRLGDFRRQLIGQVKETLQKEVFPDLRIAPIHGKMKPKEKDAVMRAFAAHEIDVLVSTTVIEVGVDVPNASLMVIEHAERFGLAQLHQLRGRVGRGAHQSACILIFAQPLSQAGRERLKAIYEHTDGFVIAREDLRIRGPGEFIGARQSGVPLLRYADLEEDAVLVDIARGRAEEILRDAPRVADAITARWFGGRANLLKA